MATVRYFCSQLGAMVPHKLQDATSQGRSAAMGGGERGEGRAMTLLPKGTAVTSIAWAIAAMATLHGGEWMRTCIGHSARTTVKARW